MYSNEDVSVAYLLGDGARVGTAPKSGQAAWDAACTTRRISAMIGGRVRWRRTCTCSSSSTCAKWLGGGASPPRARGCTSPHPRSPRRGGGPLRGGDALGGGGARPAAGGATQRRGRHAQRRHDRRRQPLRPSRRGRR